MSDGNGQVHETSAEEPAQGFECPACGTVIDVTPGETAAVVSCPACGEHVLIPAVDGSTELAQEEEAAARRAEERQSELDGLRMRHVIVTRRAAIRSRTYNVLGAAGCVMAAVKLGIIAVQQGRRAGWHAAQGALVVMAVAAVYFGWHFLQRARAWGRESRGSAMPEPETPPDFSTLSDGSQHARSLEELKE